MPSKTAAAAVGIALVLAGGLRRRYAGFFLVFWEGTPAWRRWLRTLGMHWQMRFDWPRPMPWHYYGYGDNA